MHLGIGATAICSGKKNYTISLVTLVGPQKWFMGHLLSQSKEQDVGRVIPCNM